MRTTIDGAGRLVVPKALRELLGLHAGQEVDVQVRDGRLEVEPTLIALRLEEGPAGVRAVPDSPVQPLSAAQVRETLEQTRR